MKIYNNIFNQIISLENLFLAWDEFKCGKGKKQDVREFEWELEKNIFKLHEELINKTYKHSPYTSFFIQDPKQRNISKAKVRDRVLHHAVFSKLNPIFEPTFIANSFSCRVGKGTHKGVRTLAKILNKVSGNGHKPCFALKCDVKKFFDSVDHDILKKIVKRRIKDQNALWLVDGIIDSYASKYSNLFDKKGVPIGNLTSQLFANIYLNELDYHIKTELKVKHYLRYTDDFIVVSRDRNYLQHLIGSIICFLQDNLKLKLHPNKIIIRKFHQGVDFLGYVVRPHYSSVRTKTKNWIFKKIRARTDEYLNGSIDKQTLEQSLQSYLGVLSHADSFKLSEKLKNDYWFWVNG